MNIFINVVSSNTLTKFLWLSWLFAILFAWWYIPPRTDDGIYLIPAISVLNNYLPGAFIDDSVRTMFFIFPGQPFLHGLFLKSLDFFFIDLGINTYRVFNYLMTLLLLYLVNNLYAIVFREKLYRIISINISLILLGLSQFSIQFFVNRPEITGLVFFIVGLISTIKFINSSEKNNISVIVAFFSYAVSIICHINFAVLSGSAFLYLLILITVSHKKYLKYLPVFFIPIVFFIILLFYNFEAAQDQLFNRANQATEVDFSSIVMIFSVALGGGGDSLLHSIYLGLHAVSFLAVLIALLIFLGRSNYNGNDEITTLFKILSIALIFIFIFMESWPGNYLLVSFVSIVLLTFFLVPNINLHTLNRESKDSINKFYSKFLFIFLALLPLSLPMFHTMKVYMSNGFYFNHHQAKNQLETILGKDEHVFIITGQLLPLFSSKINADFDSISATQREKVHWYFPVNNLSPSSSSISMVDKVIKEDILLMQGAVWGTLTRNVLLSEDGQKACLSLVVVDRYIKMTGVKILYKSRESMFFSSVSSIPSDRQSCYESI